jgi:hypothetical protein
MPIDASDLIRKRQDTVLFKGYLIAKQTTQPDVNVSTCIGFSSSSNINNYPSYEYKYAIQEGRTYFSTCQGTN